MKHTISLALSLFALATLGALLASCLSGGGSSTEHSSLPGEDLGADLSGEEGEGEGEEGEGEEGEGESPCEPGSVEACGLNVGECSPGERRCEAGGSWGPCLGAQGPSAERCDELDNDCDGEIDEDAERAPSCAMQEGVCVGSARTCRDGAWSPCTAEDYEANSEDYVDEEPVGDCDGLDNDCDGEVDEQCSCAAGETRACGSAQGICRPGTQRCVDGVWGACEGASGPRDESCNGEDDDCDGAVDEGCDCRNGETRACGPTLGICESGQERCADGRWSACEGGVGPRDERCNGLDDDCDGEADEGCECLDGETRSCGSSTGACQAGVERCGDGHWGACEGSIGPVAELCHDGVDNDCDGTVDEGCRCDVGTSVQVDNDIPNSGYSEDPAANWNSRPTGSCHGTYRYLSTEVGDASRRGRAIWRPAIQQAGWYQVTTSFRATGHRTPDADYILHNDRGDRIRRTIDQRSGDDCTHVRIGTTFCEVGGNCRLVLDGSDDGESDAADITVFTLIGCGPEPPDPGDGCQAIANHAGWELCFDGGEVCHGVFTDGAGCRAFCAAAGMSCVAAYGGEPGCQKEPGNPLACNVDTGHQSDWCECAR